MTTPNEQSESLKPCPFCGSSDIHVSTIDGIVCRGCHVQVLGAGNNDDAQTWNRRPSTADRGGEVEVKALEWQGPNCRSLVGYYSCEDISESMAENDLWILLLDQKKIAGPFNTLEATKAAAQADYTARIRSALATTGPRP